MRTLLKFVAWVIGILAAVAGLLYLFVFDVWTLPKDDALLTASVKPTLSAEDVLLVSRRGTPSRGALVRCSDPDAPGRFVVARIVGVPGEMVRIKQEHVALDKETDSTTSAGRCEPPTRVVQDPTTGSDVELECDRNGLTGIEHGVLTAKTHVQPDVESKVDPEKVYLISDNRHFHLDSRDFGQISPDACRHIVFRLWSAEGFSDSAHRFTLIW